MSRGAQRAKKSASKKNVLRVAVGCREEPFAPSWRFWTHRDSAYFAQRAAGALFKGSFHPASAKHKSAAWTHGFTSESDEVFDDTGRRRSHTWEQAPEFMPGWYRGPAISIPRLPDRKYDLPHFDGMSDVRWVAAPAVGNATFLALLLSDARPDLPPFELGDAHEVVGTLPMRNGWHLSVVSAERPLEGHERPYLEKTLDEMRIGINEAPVRGSASGAIVRVTTSPKGLPLFVQIVLGSDNFYDQRMTKR